jgi:hypothetical protein
MHTLTVYYVTSCLTVRVPTGTTVESICKDVLQSHGHCHVHVQKFELPSFHDTHGNSHHNKLLARSSMTVKNGGGPLGLTACDGNIICVVSIAKCVRAKPAHKVGIPYHGKAICEDGDVLWLMVDEEWRRYETILEVWISVVFFFFFVAFDGSEYFVTADERVPKTWEKRHSYSSDYFERRGTRSAN